MTRGEAEDLARAALTMLLTVRDRSLSKGILAHWTIDACDVLGGAERVREALTVLREDAQ